MVIVMEKHTAESNIEHVMSELISRGFDVHRSTGSDQTILGIVGAFVATYLGQAIGWYRAGEGAGLIGAVVGAIIVLVIWGMVAGNRRRSV